MSFTSSYTFKAIRNTGLIGIIIWALATISFFVSFEFGKLNAGWGQVGWIVPLGVLFVGFFVFACAFAYCLFTAYREFMLKDNNIQLGILGNFDKYTNSGLASILCTLSFIVTAMVSAVSMFPVMLIAFGMCFLIKNNKI